MAVVALLGLTSFLCDRIVGRKRRPLPKCFLDICINGKYKGRILIEMEEEVAPRIVENFRALCVGLVIMDENGDRKLHYKGSKIHGIHSSGIIVGGDFQNGDGTGGVSAFGDSFNLNEEENRLTSDEPGTVGMLVHNNSQIASHFVIFTQPFRSLSDNVVVFGKVTEGLKILKNISELGDEEGIPLAEIIIGDCGEDKS